MEKNKQKPERKSGFASHFRFVVTGYIISFSIVYIIYALSPKYYKATASILQPLERDMKISTEASDFAEKIISQIRTNTELFLSILTSRTTKDNIIEQFGLVKEYGVRNIDQARILFDKKVEVSLTKNKIIEIRVVDTDPVRTADIANFFIEKLDTSMKELVITAAKQDRLFIEKRLNETESEINKLEASLANIKNRNKLVADKELVQISQTAGVLMNNLFQKRLELRSKSEVLSKDSFEIQMLTKDISNIEEALSGILSSENELIKILRDLKAQEEVYNFLTSKLEESKINEARDTPIVQVLDKAVIPAKIYSPDIRLFLVIQTAVFGGLAILIFFFDLLKFLGSI